MRTTFYRYLRDCAASGFCRMTAREGSCQGRLDFDTFSVHIGLLENAGMVLFQCCTGLLPSWGREEFYTMLLKANGDFAASDGFTLGVDEEEEAVTLQCARVMADLDQEAFNETLQRMLLTASVWLPRIENWRPSANSTSPDEVLLMQHMLKV